MYRYALITEDGNVVGVSNLSGVVSKPHMILVDENFDLKNKRWNGTGWETYEPPEPEPPQPTQLDRIEELAKAKNSDIAQSAIDSYTIELIEGGLL